MKSILSFFNHYLKKEWVIILLLIICTIPAFKTLFFAGYFPHHDDLQFMRIYEMEKCFADGQIPCRWIPDMGYGYGYPLFNFYPPFPFYLGTLIRFVTHIQILDTVKVLFIAQFVTSAVLMYLFAKQWWGKAGGFMSAIFYTYAPYHAVDLYVRGALNEAWAMAFAPGVGWALTRFYKRSSVPNCILLGVMIAGMLLSHNPMVIIFSPLLAAFGLYLCIVKVIESRPQALKLLGGLILGGGVGLGLAAFFSLPVLLEQKYVHIDTLYSGFFNYTVHFATKYQLFISRYWDYGGSTFGPVDYMSFQIGWLHWGGVLVILVASTWFAFKKQWRWFGTLVLFIAYFAFTTLMTHEKSTPIWLHIPIFQTLQFPWRFLSTVVFCASFVMGALFVLPLSKLVRWTLFVSLGLAVFLINIEFFHVQYQIHITDYEKRYHKTLWETQITAGIFDYLPIYAVAPPGRAAPGNYQILAGNPTIDHFASGSASVRFQSHATSSSTIRLNIFDFPTWKIYADGQPIAFNHDNFLGLMTFDLPAGDHAIEAKLTNTPIRTFGLIVSIVTFASVSAYSIFGLIRRRRQNHA